METNTLTINTLKLEFRSLFQRILDEDIYEYSKIDLDDHFLALFKQYISHLYLTSFDSLKNTYSSLVKEIFVKNDIATLFLIDKRDSEFRVKFDYSFLKSNFSAYFIYNDNSHSFSCVIVDNDCQTPHYQYLYPDMHDGALNSILQINILSEAYEIKEIRYSFKKSKNGRFNYLHFRHDGSHVYSPKAKMTGQLVEEIDELLSIENELELSYVFQDLHDLDNFLFFCDHYPLFSDYLNEYGNYHQFSMEYFLELYSDLMLVKERHSIFNICRMQTI